MKNVVYAVVLTVMGIIILLIILTTTITTNRQIEIDNSLKQAVEGSIERCVTTRSYSLDDNRQFVADLIRQLSNAIENDSDLTLDIMEADKDKGYLAIRVTQTYNTPFSHNKKSVYETVAYLDKSTRIPERETINVSFEKQNGELIAKKAVIVGESITPIITNNCLYSYWENKATNERLDKCSTTLGIAGNEDVTFVAI